MWWSCLVPRIDNTIMCFSKVTELGRMFFFFSACVLLKEGNIYIKDGAWLGGE